MTLPLPIITSDGTVIELQLEEPHLKLLHKYYPEFLLALIINVLKEEDASREED